MLQRSSLIAFLTIVLAGCGSESTSTSTSTSTSASASASTTSSAAAAPASTRSEAVTCDIHYAEVREAILGVLRGTESLSLISLATGSSEGVLSAPAAGTTPAQMNCRSQSRSLRRDRKPNTGVAWALAPQCDALLQRLDSSCLKPLAEQGTPFSRACNLALVGVASVSGGQQANMSNAGLCESAMRDL
jgi:hypothetical protein